MKEALALAKAKPLVIDYDDPEYHRRRRAARRDRIRGLRRARAIPISPGRCRTTNGTRSRSTTPRGTTGDPKGVVYHHRGAYLLAIGNVVTCAMAKHPVYLWTLPMFHCNGWCFPWSISVVAGTHVCLRAVRAAAMYDADRRPQGDASVRRADRDGDAAQRAGRREEAAAACGRSSSPPPRRRRKPCSPAMKEAGFNVTHLYGLTECYGPAVVNDWHERMGRAAACRTGGEEGAPGRALWRARSARRARPRDDGAGGARRRSASAK